MNTWLERHCFVPWVGIQRESARWRALPFEMAVESTLTIYGHRVRGSYIEPTRIGGWAQTHTHTFSLTLARTGLRLYETICFKIMLLWWIQSSWQHPNWSREPASVANYLRASNPRSIFKCVCSCGTKTSFGDGKRILRQSHWNFGDAGETPKLLILDTASSVVIFRLKNGLPGSFSPRWRYS